jgi:hypothetical protein
MVLPAAMSDLLRNWRRSTATPAFSEPVVETAPSPVVSVAEVLYDAALLQINLSRQAHAGHSQFTPTSLHIATKRSYL